MEDPQFNFDYKLDDEHRVSTIFWVDDRSRLAYKHFGDVVTFDTTYRTNKYSMLFAPFTGVNHHYHSILFGFTLLRDESESSFVWLFRAWLEAMKFKAPKVIITDQDLAMKKAITTVFPDTRHNLCTWHIRNKYPERLHHVYAKYPDFKQDFDKCVNKSLTIEEFEEKWEKLVEDYSLQDHEWLQHLYELKEQWIRVYTRRYFSAGMKTTGRSESMNATFDSYVQLPI
ncbi:hypothetical protein RJ640_015710 [Escallonia rubra]|uniref:Protein FAR1-RELATED SEQUENCE n=1 Tax=Escallonia rubra TaxID=112253 RepID=A0AA88RLR5_9ASTE|nr:hypothetical protein RJ640_015710 [Escallonia rubra]